MKGDRKKPTPGPEEVREFHAPSCGLFFRVGRRLFKERSAFQEIEIIDNPFYGRTLFLDGLVQTTERDEFFYHEMLVHPAMVAHPRPESVLIIGGGDGGTLREVLRHPVRRALLVEIDSRVIEATRKHLPWLESCLEDERAELILADGMDHLRTSRKNYDVILVDSSEEIGPSTALHGKEFYELVKKRLNPGGIASAQMGSLFFHPESLAGKRSFLKELFKEAAFYTAPAPTYPGGTWCFVFLSEDVDPLMPRRDPPAGLKYYTPRIHRAAFVLPPFLESILG